MYCISCLIGILGSKEVENYNLCGWCLISRRSQLGVKGGAPPLRVEGRALVAVGETSARKRGYSARSAATLRAGAQLNDSKALKGCGGKQEFSPTVFMNYLTCRIAKLPFSRVPFQMDKHLFQNSPLDCFGGYRVLRPAGENSCFPPRPFSAFFI